MDAVDAEHAAQLEIEMAEAGQVRQSISLTSGQIHHGNREKGNGRMTDNYVAPSQGQGDSETQIWIP